MAEVEQEKWELSDAEVTESLRRSPDAVLREIVQSVNLEEEGRTSSITLQVNGVLVTGTLISHWLWAELLSKQASSATGNEETYFAGWSSGFKEDTADAAERLDKWDDLSAEEQREAVMQRIPAFIHLEGARVLVGNSFVPSEGTLWRGRLSEVDGWFVGGLAMKE